MSNFLKDHKEILTYLGAGIAIGVIGTVLYNNSKTTPQVGFNGYSNQTGTQCTQCWWTDIFGNKHSNNQGAQCMPSNPAKCITAQCLGTSCGSKYQGGQAQQPLPKGTQTAQCNPSYQCQPALCIGTDISNWFKTTF